MIERVTNLLSAPLVGRVYLVPSVTFPWMGYSGRPWPVFMPKHDDAEFFRFPYLHYHLDPRFLTPRVFRGTLGGKSCFGQPLCRTDIPEGPPAPSWRQFTCRREMPGYPFHDRAPVKAIQVRYSGRHCRRGSGGWICPHRKTPLGSFPIDAQGYVTCPLHGLKVHAESGIVSEPFAGVQQALPMGVSAGDEVWDA